MIYSSGSTPNPFTWNGAYGYEWLEFTGLYHVGAREYDPRTARWLQRDPIGVGGGHPNVYLYCGNEPVNSSDPSGLDVEDDDPTQDIWKGLTPNSQDKKKAELNEQIYRAATVARTGLATALEVHPLGSLSGAIYGKGCFNEKLTWVQRGAAFLSSIPLIGTFFKGEKIIAKVIKLKRNIALIGGGVLKTNTEIRNIVIIAEGRGIDDVSRLIDQYGGLRKHWKKMKGTGVATDPQTGKRALVEVHWYECHGIGKVELKNNGILQWLDK